jgi:undecaprenyl diphosphate synthase
VAQPQTQAAVAGTPRHVAVIMDGNGRWASRRALPRHFGHRAGVKAVRSIIEGCARRGVEALTLFAFSSENWQRPDEEVTRLMELFVESIDRETDELDRNGIRLRFIGELRRLRDGVRERIARAESRTGANTRMTLYVALSYGGRWDIVQAARALARRAATGDLDPRSIDEPVFAAELALAGAPEPDLFIRTGGEQRISNFLLWHLAYTELYFCETLWPDFDDAALELALQHYARRQRRFGLAPTQVQPGG